MKEIRSYNFEVRADINDEHGHFIYGTPIVFGQPTIIHDWAGDYEEVIEKGALDKTDLRDVRFLVNHNTDMIPLARSRNNNEHSTMQMTVADHGMDIRTDLDVDRNVEASALYSATERGDISGMSFMMMVDGDRWEGLDTEMPRRTITSIRKVLEVSAVTFPAYEQTTLEARAGLDSHDSVLDSAKKAYEERANKAKRIKMLCEL